MAVQSNLHGGRGLVRGDVISIRRIFTKVPSGLTITGAVLTVKDTYNTPDPGLFQKSVISTNSPTIGQIETSGITGISKVRFDLTAADTLLFVADVMYPYDIQLTFSDNSKLTIERGETSAQEEVTES